MHTDATQAAAATHYQTSSRRPVGAGPRGGSVAPTRPAKNGSIMMAMMEASDLTLRV